MRFVAAESKFPNITGYKCSCTRGGQFFEREKKEMHPFGWKKKMKLKNRNKQSPNLQTYLFFIEKTKLTKSAFYYSLLWLLKTSQFSFYNFRSREGLAASGPVWSHWQKAEAE